jgi:AraC-like DNA-binding protein
MDAHGYGVETVRTRDMPADDRLDRWSETVTAYQCALGYDYPEPDRFQAVATRQRTDRFQLVTWRISQSQSIRRTHRQIRTEPAEHYRLMVPVGAPMDVRIDGRDSVLTSADGVLFVPDAPFEVRLAPGSRGIVATLPRDRMDVWMGRSDLLHRRLPLGHGPGRLLSTLLTALAGERDELTRPVFDALCGQAAELAGLLIADTDRTPHDDLDDQVRLYIRHHAHDPDLTGAAVARHFGWSLRHIQAVLRRAGTSPSELIRESRLDLARTRLASPQHRDRTVTAIAHASGFRSIDAFERMFKRRYRRTPTEYRRDGG